jgi:hypothetical protein
MKILKILKFNFSSTVLLVKKRLNTKTIKFQFDFTNIITEENIKNINI